MMEVDGETEMAFDPKCYELAEYFLPSSLPDNMLLNRFAQHIQDAAADWLNSERDRLAATLSKSAH